MTGYRLKLIRHGITQGNLDGKYIGVTDLPLCSEGAEELYNKLEENDYGSVQKVFISPLKRCRETAAILYPNTFISEIPELIEMNFGDFENKKAEDIMNSPEYKKFLKGGLDNSPPNGESMREVVERCVSAMEQIVSSMIQEGLTNCAVITHGGIIMNLLSCFGLPKYNPNDLVCDFGEGYEVMITASMWQRSSAFEILERFPYINNDNAEPLDEDDINSFYYNESIESESNGEDK